MVGKDPPRQLLVPVAVCLLLFLLSYCLIKREGSKMGGVLLCGPDWPVTVTDIPAPASEVLGLKMDATMPFYQLFLFPRNSDSFK